MNKTSFRKKVAFLVNDFLEWIRAWIWNIIAYFFAHVRVEAKWEEEVRKALQKGTVVHILRSAHLSDSLGLIHLLRKAGLPSIGYVYGLEKWFFRPFRWIYRFMAYHEKGIEDRKHVGSVLDGGGSIIICLRMTPKTLKVRGTEMGEEPLGWLVDRVKEKGESIILLPHAFIWGRRPEKQESGLFDKIFGPRESPGAVRSIVQALRSFRGANIIACTTVDLKDYVEKFPEAGEGGTVEGALQRRLAAYLDARRKLVAGPATMNRWRTADLIMSDAELVDVIRKVKKETGKTEDEVRAECRVMLDEIMPNYHYGFINAWEILLEKFGVFSKVFDGVYYEPEDVEKIRDLAFKGSIIFLPGHRSHVDYILLSYVLGHFFDVMVPHIAAGKNLSFWPLGWWFRGSAAFFIRRTLGDDELYKEVLAAYIRRIMRDRQHIEIFMEGTRSRSGKMLPPKLGLFSIVLDAIERLPKGSEVNFLPVSINYDRVIEEGSYSRQQSGVDKRAENITDLVETGDVLESRFGRIYVRFGKPLSIEEIRRDYPSSPGDEDSIRRIGYRLFYEIDRGFHITPTALASTVLLCGPMSGRSEEDFFKDCVFYLKVGAATGKMVSPVLRPCLDLTEEDVGNEDNPAWVTLKEIMYHAIHFLADDELITMSAAGGGVYRAPENARIRLDYYRNTFYGTMAPQMLACRSCLFLGGETVELDTLKDAARYLSRLFKYEFIFNPHLPFEANFLAVLQMLESMGFIAIDTKSRTVAIRRRKDIERFGALLESLIESYYTTIRAIPYCRKEGMTEREVIRRSFALHRRLMLHRKVFRPEARNRSAGHYCLKALRDMGVLTQVKHNVFNRSEAFADREKIEELAARIYGFIRTSE